VTIHITSGTNLNQLSWNVTGDGFDYFDRYYEFMTPSYCLPQSLYYIHFQGSDSTDFAYNITVDGNEIASGHVYTAQALMHFDTAEIDFEMTSTANVEWTLSKYFDEVASGSATEMRTTLTDGSYSLELVGGSAFTIQMNGKNIYSSLGTSASGETVYFRVNSGIGFLLSASQFEEDKYSSVGYHLSTTARVLLGLLSAVLAIVFGVFGYRYIKRRQSRKFSVEMISTAEASF